MNIGNTIADANVNVTVCGYREEIRLYGTPGGLRYMAEVVRSVAEHVFPPTCKAPSELNECRTIQSGRSKTLDFMGASLQICNIGSTDEYLRGYLADVPQFGNHFLRQRRSFITHHLLDIYPRNNGSFTPEQLAGLDEEQDWFDAVSPETYSVDTALAVAYPKIDKSPRLVIAGTCLGLNWIAKSLNCMADEEYGPYNPKSPEKNEHYHSYIDGEHDVMLDCGMDLVYGRCDHRKDGSVDWYRDCRIQEAARFTQFLNWAQMTE